MLKHKPVDGQGVKFYYEVDGQEVGRAYLYLLHNDLHKQPCGFLEDVFVSEAFRGRGIAQTLLKAVIEEARRRECYKMVATSREERTKVHSFYERLGFRNYGFEFRMDFPTLSST